MTDETLSIRLCNLPKVDPLPLPGGLRDDRKSALLLTANKWINGTTITFYFKDVGPDRWIERQKDEVRNAFAIWKALDIGLEFAEVKHEADALLLIGFIQDDGSWSYVGTQVRRQRRHGCNMNFGWDLTTEWGKATALHEIGHALGMPHEHQNPNSGIVWNEQRVLDSFRDPPRWTDEDTRWNILRKISAGAVQGSAWDPRSIMHYPFEPGLLQSPPPYDTQGVAKNLQLSANDAAWMRYFYPPITATQPISADVIVPVAREIGAQTDFTFTPMESREYRLEAVGAGDMRIALARVLQGAQSRMLAVADDAATDENAAIIQHLERGKTYKIHARTRYASVGGAPGLRIR